MDSYDGGYYDSYIMAMRMIRGRLLDLCREGLGYQETFGLLMERNWLHFSL